MRKIFKSFFKKPSKSDSVNTRIEYNCEEAIKSHPKAIHVCPICLGRGRVPNGFYSSLGTGYSSSSITPEMCRSCNGAGYIIC